MLRADTPHLIEAARQTQRTPLPVCPETRPPLTAAKAIVRRHDLSPTVGGENAPATPLAPQPNEPGLDEPYDLKASARSTTSRRVERRR